MITYMRLEKGFTLLEVLLILAIFGLIGGLSIPFYQSFQISSELDNTTQEVVQIIRQAQIKAMSSEGLSDFGVHFNGQQYILFRGSVYNPLDVYNETFEIEPSISISTGGNNNIIFISKYGIPNVEANIVISSSNGKNNSLTINSLGVVNVN